MKCKKCGCDVLTKVDDWYKCANCGAMIFDTEIHPEDVKSPTKKIEKIEDDFNIEIQNGTPVKEKPAIDKAKDKQDKKEEKAENETEEKSKLREAIEFCIPIVAAIILAIILKSFVFANAIVPTGSMLNTIQERDRIIASRLAYITSDPERYDIIIFKYPDDEDQNYVKRVIGLPGETVEIVNGIVYVTKTDGETVMLDDSFVTNCIPNGDFGPFHVPEDSYFMMGDNRNSSWDSRYWKNKYVHKDKIVGQVKFKYFPGISKIE